LGCTDEKEGRRNSWYCCPTTKHTHTHTFALCHVEAKEAEASSVSYELAVRPLAPLQAMEWKGRPTYFEMLMMRLLF